MNCPRCAVPLKDVTAELNLFDVHGLGCAQCRGHWLEQKELNQLQQVVDVRWLELRHLPPADLQAELLTCPRCTPARHLNKMQSDRDRKVVLDVCAHCHGVWLDGGELRAIQEKGVGAALLDAVRFFMGKR
jgi:uncharacterized protein